MSGQTVNHREVIAGLSTITSTPEYLRSTNGFLDVNVEATIAAPTLATTLVNGQQTVTTSAVALPSGALTQGVVLGSLSTNTASIFVGATGVTTSTGYELQPGASVGMAVDNTNKIFVRCASTSPVVTWVGS